MTGDVEGAPAVTVVERVDQDTIDAGVVVMVDELRVGRVTPFIAASAGDLRQLHEGPSVVEQGHNFYAGSGVTRGWTWTCLSVVSPSTTARERTRRSRARS